MKSELVIIVSHFKTQRLCLYFLPKKDIIFPCPGLVAGFFPPFNAAGAADALGLGFGTVSSSENDSQTASSLVTVKHQ
jgi:hypothetical protein